jgi:hypothetical protein
MNPGIRYKKTDLYLPGFRILTSAWLQAGSASFLDFFAFVGLYAEATHALVSRGLPHGTVPQSSWLLFVVLRGSKGSSAALPNLPKDGFSLPNMEEHSQVKPATGHLTYLLLCKIL